MRCVATLAIALGIGSVSTGAMAASHAGGSMKIQAVVPEICKISVNEFVLTEDGRLTGGVQEFCNAATGYQIFASHRPLSATENASVKYGQDTADLNMSGLSAVAFRSGQRIEYVPVEIEATDLEAPLAVAFTMSPI